MSELTVSFTEELLNITVPNDSLEVSFTEELLDVGITDDGLEVTFEEDNLNITVGSDLEVEFAEESLDISFGEIVEITNNYATGASYTHTQSVASTTWTITHSLEKYPSVTVIDSGGSYLITDIVYTNTNTLVLTFSAAVGGTAYLN